MSRVRSKGSEIEQLLCRELWKRNLRYRRNIQSVYGKPDIAFIRKKIAVFVDSEFWHGFNWETKQNDIKSNRDFWIPKIERNIARDREVTEHLTKDGWIVLRFWGNEIKKNLTRCADAIEECFRER